MSYFIHLLSLLVSLLLLCYVILTHKKTAIGGNSEFTNINIARVKLTGFQKG